MLKLFNEMVYYVDKEHVIQIMTDNAFANVVAGKELMKESICIRPHVQHIVLISC